MEEDSAIKEVKEMIDVSISQIMDGVSWQGKLFRRNKHMLLLNNEDVSQFERANEMRNQQK